MLALFSDTAKPFYIPIAGLITGAAMMSVEKTATPGTLVLYFGAQSFMNIFMGWLMRTKVTLPAGTEIAFTGETLEKDLTGCPAGFALTALQQVVSFAMFWIGYLALYNTSKRYQIKQIKTKFEVLCIVIFGCVFALNIALNNFSLGYISIAVNLIIRSCLPLTTFLSQKVLASFDLYKKTDCKWLEITLMVVGVGCAAGFTWARIAGSAATGHGGSTGSMILGVIMCVASLLCGSLNLALAGVLGGQTKLNVFDTVAYMAPPATLFLLPIACFLQKPVPGEWPKVFGQDHMSDLGILLGVWSINKGTIAWLVLSGIFSFVYNIIQFNIVHKLSPAATAMGGNFNKAALIFLTLLLPFLRVSDLPGPPYNYCIWFFVILNIAAFTGYSYLQIKDKEEKPKETKETKEEKNLLEADAEANNGNADEAPRGVRSLAA